MNRRHPGALKAQDKAKMLQARGNLGKTAEVGMRSTLAKAGIHMVDKAVTGGRTNHRKKTAMHGLRAKMVSLSTSNKGRTRTRIMVDSGSPIRNRSKQKTVIMIGVVLRLIPTVGTKRKAAHGTKRSLTKTGGPQLEQPNHGQSVEAQDLVESGLNMQRRILMFDGMHKQSKMEGAGQISPVMIAEVTLATKAGERMPEAITGIPAN